MGRVKIDASTVLLLVFFFAFEDMFYVAAIVFCVALHELGHLLAARALSVPVRSIKIGIFGARIELDALCRSYPCEIMIAAAGPAVNIILAAGGILYVKMHTEDGAVFFVLLNLALCLLNLLPIRSLDGGRIITALLCMLFGVASAERILWILSCITLVCLWCASVFLWFSTGKNITLAILCVYMFFHLIINREY